MLGRSAPSVPLFAAAACGALIAIATSPPPLALLLGAVAAFATAWAARTAAAQALGVLALAALLSGGGAAIAREAQQTRRARLPAASAVFQGIAAEVALTRTGSTRIVLDGDGALVAAEAIPLRARIEVFAPPGADPVRPGDRVRVRGVARLPAPADLPGEMDGALLSFARSVDARVSARATSDIAVVERAASWRPFASVRLWLFERITALSTEREAGLLLALLVGDTSLLTDEQRTLYRDIGAGHLLAVSGLQVSLLALAFRALFLPLFVLLPGGRNGRGARSAGLLAVALVWAFVLVCGAPPSALRAGAMASAVLFAHVLGRRARVWDAIGIAGLLTVLVSPESVVDASFLLSYGAVLGLALAPRLEEPDGDGTRRLAPLLASAVFATAAAGLITLPISAFLFGQVSLGGVVANIVLVPAASLLQVPALFCGVLGAVFSSCTLLWLGAESALLLEALVAGLDDVMGGVTFVEAPSAFVTAAAAVLVVALLAAVNQRRFAPAGAAVLALVLVLVGAARAPDGVRISVVPIGQGDATLFEMSNGSVMLVDGGGTLVGRDPGEALLVPFLRRRGVERIDVLVLSHPHPDHGNGLVAVAKAFPVGALWHSGADATDPILAPLLQALKERSPGAQVLATPALLGEHRFGDVVVDVLAPAPVERTPRYPELGENDNSLVLRVCLASSCALWPGDVEALGEALLVESTPPARLRAALVKAGHHGSNTSSTAAFVNATGAQHVVFCTGRDNTFFFPHAPVIERWRDAGAVRWDTAVHGLITAFLSEDGVQVMGFHEGEVAAPPDG